MSKEILLNKIQALSRPLVRICLNHGVKLGEMVDALKRAYVEVAQSQLTQTGEAVSTSRITVMTGVHRTDVAKIRGEDNFSPRPKHTASDVIGLWRYDRRFCSSPGKPRPLTVEGRDSEFAQLVRSVSLSLSPYTVLFELERLGLARKMESGKLKLTTRMLVVRDDAPRALELLAEDAEDLFRAVDQNAFLGAGEEPLNHHIKTEYTNIPKEHLPEIRNWFMNQGAALHERARKFLSRFDRDITKNVEGTGRIRAALGSFSFIEEDGDK